MREASGKMIGIRLRGQDGRKWAITGSRQGLFMSTTNGNPLLFVTEGQQTRQRQSQ